MKAEQTRWTENIACDVGRRSEVFQDHHGSIVHGDGGGSAVESDRAA